MSIETELDNAKTKLESITSDIEKMVQIDGNTATTADLKTKVRNLKNQINSMKNLIKSNQSTISEKCEAIGINPNRELPRGKTHAPYIK